MFAYRRVRRGEKKNTILLIIKPMAVFYSVEFSFIVLEISIVQFLLNELLILKIIVQFLLNELLILKISREIYQSTM